jgi:monooxygenase
VTPDPRHPESPPPEPLFDVLIVGAGLSGIGAARHLQKRCPDQRYAILEARAHIGGTWDLFRYPGIRSDSDMYTLGYSFKPWTGASAIADGPSILDYIRETADEADIVRHIRFGHAVRSACWSSAQACWTVQAQIVGSGAHGQHRQDGGDIVTFRTRFLYMCSGYYNYDQAFRPEFAGEADFGGTIVQPQFWPGDLDYAGKRVVVIGSGATAVTLVPSMATTAAHVTMLQRSPSYIVTQAAQDKSAQRLQRWLPAALAYTLTRWKNVIVSGFLYRLALRQPDFVKQKIVGMAVAQAGSSCDGNKHFTPHYKPWDQRICVAPDGDLFRHIRKGSASVVTDTIAHFTGTGLKLQSGAELAADIVVLATGLKLNLLGDVAFGVDGVTINPSAAMVYKGMMLSDMPNLVMCFGYTNASWTLKADLTAQYFCRLIKHMGRQKLSAVVARRDRQVKEQPFLGFTSGYVQRASALLPKQGATSPWRVHQSYVKDMLTIRYGRIDDGVLHFTAHGKQR